MIAPHSTRFWAKVDRSGGIDACWPWTAARTGGGRLYGQFKLNGRPSLAHRVAAEWAFGDIPHGMQVDHICRHTLCVNPLHLRIVTPAVNVLSGNTVTAANAAKEHCPKGHPLSGRNLYVWSGGTNHQRGFRGCRQCRAEAQRRYVARKAGQSC